jgi:hypothetical protein
MWTTKKKSITAEDKMIHPFEKRPGHDYPNASQMSCYTHIYYFVCISYVCKITACYMLLTPSKWW